RRHLSARVRRQRSRRHLRLVPVAARDVPGPPPPVALLRGGAALEPHRRGVRGAARGARPRPAAPAQPGSAPGRPLAPGRAAAAGGAGGEVLTVSPTLPAAWLLPLALALPVPGQHSGPVLAPASPMVSPLALASRSITAPRDPEKERKGKK